MPTIFTNKQTAALNRNGWSLLSTRRASRFYRGGLRAIITAAGGWTLTLGGDVIAEGTEPDAINAAMEANNRAWKRSEYKTATTI